MQFNLFEKLLNYFNNRILKQQNNVPSQGHHEAMWRPGTMLKELMIIFIIPYINLLYPFFQTLLISQGIFVFF